MASQVDTVGKTANQTLMYNVSSKVPSKEPALKLNFQEFKELKRLETAGDNVGAEDLKKRVRQRMESQLASDSTITTTSTFDKESKEVKSTTAVSTLRTDGKSSENTKNMAINHKKPEATVSTSTVGNNRKKEKPFMRSESSNINKEKNGANKEKLKSSVSSSKIIRGKETAVHREKSTSLAKDSNKLLNNINKGKQTVVKSTSTSTSSNINNSKLSVDKEKTRIKPSSSKSDVVTSKSLSKLEKYVEKWKKESSQERGEKYIPLESYLPSEILNDKDQMVIVEKIAREFELERLKKLLEQDKEKPNGNKKLAQERIKDFNTRYTRLEIATCRNEKGPKNDQKIRAFIAFLNDKNILKRKLAPLDVIRNPSLLSKVAEYLHHEKSRKEFEKQKHLGIKRKIEGGEERRQQKLEAERKRENLKGKLTELKRRQDSMAETTKRQDRVLPSRQKVFPKTDVQRLSNVPKKMMINRNGASTSTPTSLKKRTFDERSEATRSSRAPKRRNVGDVELDLCEMDEEAVNENMSSIIHSIFRRGRPPIYKMVDDNDDDAMEVSGFEVFREEERSSRLARKEDEDEERAEQLRRNKKLKRKNV